MNLVELIQQLAKTKKLERLLANLNTNDPDKKPTGSSRGVGTAVAPAPDETPAPSFTILSDASYTMQYIIDSLEDTSKRVTSITQMKDTTTPPDKRMVLNPSGLYTPFDTSIVYTTNESIYSVESIPDHWADTGIYSKTPDLAADLFVTKEVARLGVDLYKGSRTALVPFTVTDAQLIDGTYGHYNFETTYPMYTYTVTIEKWDGSFTSTYYVLVIGYPSGYDTSIYILPGSAGVPLVMTVVTINLTTGAYTGVSEEPAVPSFPSAPNSFCLALKSTGLWTPDPAESPVITPTKYASGVHVIDMKFGETFARTARVCPTKTGGFMCYETVQSVPQGYLKIFDRTGTFKEVVPSTSLNQYLP